MNVKIGEDFTGGNIVVDKHDENVFRKDITRALGTYARNELST